jgi:uncharacterized membrane protein YesL
MALGMFLGGLILAGGGLGLAYLYHANQLQGWSGEIVTLVVNTVTTLMLMAGIFLVGVVVTYPNRERYGDLDSPPCGDLDFLD